MHLRPFNWLELTLHLLQYLELLIYPNRDLFLLVLILHILPAQVVIDVPAPGQTSFVVEDNPYNPRGEDVPYPVLLCPVQIGDDIIILLFV